LFGKHQSGGLAESCRGVRPSMTLPVSTVPGSHDERRLIRKARTGDRAAFGELYRQYASMVHGLLLARVPPDVADDLLQ
jgi:hypothetical protein